MIIAVFHLVNHDHLENYILQMGWNSMACLGRAFIGGHVQS
jgi:hypothetical protein